MEFQKLALMDLSDENLRTISALIYETDPFIYPAMFASKEDAVALFPVVIRSGRDAMFCKKNLYAALEKGKIVAIILWHEGALRWDERQFKSIAEAKLVHLPASFDLVSKKYFSGYDDASLQDRVSLINICVSKHCQGMGIGKRMLTSFFGDIGDKCYELYCLEDNQRAIALYERLGFRAVARQRAFTIFEKEVYSVKMIRDKNGLWGEKIPVKPE